MKKLITALVLLTATLVPGVAGATPPADPGEFGHHVASCAQEHGFDAAHNPGMHHGLAGWSGGGC